jgi:hypothetical protein
LGVVRPPPKAPVWLARSCCSRRLPTVQPTLSWPSKASLGATASVKKVGDNSYQETDKRDGKVVSVTTFTVGADGKLNVTSEDKRNDSTMKYLANRQ